MSWDRLEKAGDKGPEALFMWVFWRLLAVGIIVGAVGFVFNPFKQAGRIINKTIDADNVIYNYEWFKQRHESISALDKKVADAEAAADTFKKEAGPRDTWHREDRIEHSRLAAVALGLTQQRADMAAEYNARGRMANRSIFKMGDVELPQRIPE